MKSKLISKGLALIVFALGSIQMAHAQSKAITGQVLDEAGEGLPGVTILIKDSTDGTVTDIDGNYKLSVDDNAVLVYSYLGYLDQEVAVGGRSVLDINLEPDAKQLEEIVVIGYGTQRKKDLTGSVGLADVSDMQKAPVATFEQAFAGRVAGVNVSSAEGQPGGDLQIAIRGLGSMTQDTSPLFVIDGMPIEDLPSGMLDPSDIEKISVLKDASAAAIYGARGANGVIIITTKGGQEGAARVTYDGYFGVSRITKHMDLLSPFEYVALQDELDSTRTANTYLLERSLESYRDEEGIDWQDHVFQDATIQSHKVSVTGGSKDNTSYSLTLSTFDQEGVIINSGFNRFYGKLKIDQKVTDKLRAGMYGNYSRTKQFGARTSENSSNFSTYLLNSVLSYRNIGYNPDVDLLTEPLDPDIDPSINYQFNPLISAQNEINETLTSNILLNAYLDYQIIEGLKLKIDGGYVVTNRERDRFNNSNTRYGHPQSSSGKGPNGSINNLSKTNLNSNATLTYKTKIGSAHNLTVMAGSSVQEVKWNLSEFRAFNVASENNGVNGLDSGTPDGMTTNAASSRLLSYFGRAHYSLLDKYMITATIRRDGSSKFAEKWGTFPSVAFAWQLGDETFVKDLGIFSEAKFRASWGQLGNNRVDEYASKGLFDYNNDKYAPTGFPLYYAFNNSLQLGVAPTSMDNNDLKWEIGEETNFGLDFGFFASRLNISTDVYRKVTKDLLMEAQLPTATGFRSAFKNVGSIENKGLELTLSTVNLDMGDFKWTSSFNISFNKNQVLDLNEDQYALALPVSWTNKFNSISAYVSKEGQAIGQMYGYVWDGVYQYDDFNEVNGTYTLKSDVPNNGQSRGSIQPGFVKYKDINQDGQVNDQDRTVIGDPTPDHIGGFGNNFSYKGFSLNVFFQWSYGNDILNANKIYLEAPYKRNSNMLASVADRWTPENQSEVMHSAAQTEAGLEHYSSRLIEDGSFLRLKTVSLSYDFPKSLISKLNLESARMYISGQNLYTWTNYSGYDPEVSVRDTALTRGFDFSAYPRARTITVGLNFTL